MIQSDEPRTWKTRYNLVKELLESKEHPTSFPNILGVQEGSIDQCNQVLKILNNNNNKNKRKYEMVVKAASRSANKSEYCSIYFDCNMFELLDYGTFWLSDNPHVPNSIHNKAKHPRIATWTLLKFCKLKHLEIKLLVLNTHLSHVSSEARCDQMNVLLGFVKEMKKINSNISCIMCGDFNDFVNDGLWKYVTKDYKCADNKTTVLFRFVTYLRYLFEFLSF